MSFSIDQILPSIEALGDIGYWIIAAASMLEAFFLTGIVVPGTLIVDAGGVLVQRGVLDFSDLIWFVAIGSILGGEASYWTGRLAKSRLTTGSRFMKSWAYGRAEALVAQRGGMALVLGRFAGPIAGLVPLVGAMAGINRKSFVIWNVLCSISFAFAHVGIGYLIGGALGQIGGAVSRNAMLVGVLAILVVFIWWLLFRLIRLMPMAISLAKALLLSVADRPGVAGWLAARPQLRGWLAGRVDPDTFSGLPLTSLALVFGYVLIVWIDVTLDLVFSGPAMALDGRVSQLAHLFWSPAVLQVASFVTSLGGSRVVFVFLLAAVVWLALDRRPALAAGLVVAVYGDAATVSILKDIFSRPRPELTYFVETSGSFPSGHAGISIAFYGTLAYAFWRAGRISQVTALILAGSFGFAIGFSRVILIEHYLSDVLSGWLVGGLWLLVGVAMAEWQIHVAKVTVARPRSPTTLVGGYAAIALFAGLGIWQVVTYDKVRAVHSQLETVRVVTGPETFLTDTGFRRSAQSLAGVPVAPINLVFSAMDTNSLITTLQNAGWSVTAAPSASRLVDFGIAIVRDKVDPVTMLFPQFWLGMPNDLGLQSMMLNLPATLRIWDTPYRTSTGQRIFVASITPDTRVLETVPSPEAIARSRDLFVGQLVSAGQGEALSASPPDPTISIIEIR